ncbi:BMP family lipoprotein [Rhizobium hainanense]|uniref:Nucleoside-binding protein n=1 Tax=Rhizobium hainanense TaxID=52131 RepID=A0A1C3WGQ1_9HYPH|nr:BMP family ABC transporter substrate-binding protein [Rhizobium hainanense]SCB39169.1 nucleoside-binding protein [Rhizobium hainanense]
MQMIVWSGALRRALGIALSLGLLTVNIGSAVGQDLNRAPTKIVFFVNGTLGDKSFFDSGERGIERVKSELSVPTATIEAGYDPTRWENALIDLAEGGEYDTIVTGTFTMVPLVEKIAPQFPDTRFIIFDGAVDYTKCKCENVYSILFRQNEGAYLAGALAARLTQSGVPNIPAGSALGTVGAMQIPVIDDFLIGFDAGAKSVSPDIKVLKQYANSFSDPATGKEIAKAQFGQGASIIFQVAGATGQGVIEAAGETGKYAIGVDSDQAMLFEKSRPDAAKRIVTSVLKQVDNVVVRAVSLMKDGKLPFGKAESLGLKEGAIDLADNKFTQAIVPSTVWAEIEKTKAEIVDGKIIVPTAF